MHLLSISTNWLTDRQWEDPGLHYTRCRVVRIRTRTKSFPPTFIPSWCFPSWVVIWFVFVWIIAKYLRQVKVVPPILPCHALFCLSWPLLSYFICSHHNNPRDTRTQSRVCFMNSSCRVIWNCICYSGWWQRVDRETHAWPGLPVSGNILMEDTENIIQMDRDFKQYTRSCCSSILNYTGEGFGSLPTPPVPGNPIFYSRIDELNIRIQEHEITWGEREMQKLPRKAKTREIIQEMKLWFNKSGNRKYLCANGRIAILLPSLER